MYLYCPWFQFQNFQPHSWEASTVVLLHHCLGGCKFEAGYYSLENVTNLQGHIFTKCYWNYFNNLEMHTSLLQDKEW